MQTQNANLHSLYLQDYILSPGEGSAEWGFAGLRGFVMSLVPWNIVAGTSSGGGKRDCVALHWGVPKWYRRGEGVAESSFMEPTWSLGSLRRGTWS